MYGKGTASVELIKQRVIGSMLFIAANVAAASASAVAVGDDSSQQKAREYILTAATTICANAPQEGGQSKMDVGAVIDVETAAVLKKLMKANVRLSGDYVNEEHRGGD
jgi:hypothetical protein